MDGARAELIAAHRRAAAVPWWRRAAARRALGEWEEAGRRYERVVREAAEAYEPVGREISQAIRTESERAAERVREEERREMAAWERRRRLAERANWGCTVATSGGRPIVYVFRHDVPLGEDMPASAAAPGSPRLDLAGLRHALEEVNVPAPWWDDAALAATERELEGVTFAQWWQRLFSEDYRTFTAPPPRWDPSPSGDRSGGTATGGGAVGGTGTGGTGGFGGGVSCGGGF
ncbi:hypothetical protein [Streptomyces sp. NPDC053755]|uniref:hypothetical protein n=1 Tax=Streptomyces sp. NPDC053755 TaxID=3155815 RepID=UPI00343CE371